MIKILRWPVEINSLTSLGYTLNVPIESPIAYIGEDESRKLVISFVVDSAHKKKPRTFRVVSFGQEIPEGYKYVGSFQQYGGSTVWHLIEMKQVVGL